ncbi:aminodeoxychorismate/anthranilate synthase component II [Bacillaceae bacterium Marseille-Q3522]|nr:aminodeoxychorismate/anthranilate synthase component II [Bacillaceae bacterium Marseille-Q3522]
MILLIDNYDSFTYNLYQYMGELGEKIAVYRNDELTLEEIRDMNPQGIVLSPGPGRPEDAGLCTEIVKNFYRKIPILGICLGHQVIGYAFGGNVVKAKQIKHGKISNVIHEGTSVFRYLPQPLAVMRYHSLVVEKASLPDELEILAEAIDDHEIMALRHCSYPLYGIQFHPESIGTPEGKKMLKCFLNECRKEEEHENHFTKSYEF